MAEPPRGYTAVVTGYTGAIGKCVVGELLASPAWSKITLVGRRPLEALPPPYDSALLASGRASGKLEERVTNMDSLEAGDASAAFTGKDASFCCLGTTRGDAGGAAGFRAVDLDMVTAVARLSRAGGVPHFAHVTAMGANANSWLLYPQTKGEAENAIIGLHFPSTTILRPGLLNRGDMSRTVERIALWLLPSIPVDVVARAMRVQAEAALQQLKAGSGSSGTASASSAVRFVYDGEMRKLASK